ncbi:MAG: DEAD/DEAH box helicase [Opitutales bacterium]
MLKPPPDFTRDFLVELGGWTLLREARDLFEAGAVKDASWESPNLLGTTDHAGQTHKSRLSLRSTVFPENQCTCVQGRRGQICSHTIAACMAFAARKEAAEAAEAVDLAVEEDAPESAPGIKALRLSQKEGTPLRFSLYLPPKLKEAATRDAIVVRLEARIEAGAPFPLEQLQPGPTYYVPAGHYLAYALIDEWCQGEPGSLLQLNRERLHMLLDAFQNQPHVFYENKKKTPLEWEDDRIPEVYDIIEGLAPRREDDDEDAEEADDPDETEAIATLRRTRARKKEADAEDEDVDRGQVEIDGSPHFLAVRLPGRSHPNYRPVIELLRQEGFKNEPSNGRWWLRDGHKVLNFLARFQGRFEREWNARLTDNFIQRTRGIESASVAIDAQETRNGFTVNLKIETPGADPLDISQALAVGRHYIRKGKKTVLLPPEVMEKMQQAQRALSGEPRRSVTPFFEKRLNAEALADAERILEPLASHWQPPEAWQARSGALKRVADLEPPPVGKAMEQTLRTYQKIGVAWLWHLYQHELGGILADEMGLGKTIQALGLLNCIRNQEDTPGPSLVVCPAGLVENWRREAARFAPDLEIFVNHGQKRLQDPESIRSKDLIITSYSTLARDADAFQAVDFALIIGDEAQHIKNRKTQNAQALQSLIGHGRVLLTGTPVENSLDDLRSLFDFLMPGYLAEPPKGNDRDARSWIDQRNREQAAPYILRRRKVDVAPELPEKIEQVIYVPLEGKQGQLYTDVLERTRHEIFQMEMAGASEGQVRMAAFTQLLRLRQVCADPRILSPEMAAESSAKLSAFREILQEATDDGHRILVFSQFVQLLKLLRDELEDAGMDFCYLDGQTRDRMKQVDRFNNNDDIPVFLISLKAGGTGLNLTGADTVVHFDPWWNPAVEAQATDRAHRIGQTRVVTSIKLIATETVEEKVLELQRSKAAILKDLLEASDAANAKVSMRQIKDLLNLPATEPAAGESDDPDASAGRAITGQSQKVLRKPATRKKTATSKASASKKSASQKPVSTGSKRSRKTPSRKR